MAHDYYAQVADAFDRAAASYHHDYAANPIMAWLADDTYAHLCRLFPPGARLLEIGCGTGEMALRLAAADRQITAVDISPAMIAQAEIAAAGHPAQARVTWRIAAAGGLATAVEGRFDGAYSNFGPLNCEPDLAHVSHTLAGLLSPGAAFLCSVMNRWCAWEIVWGLMRLSPCEAARRLGRGWRPARMSAGPGEPDSTLPVRYFTPGEFSRVFQPHFRLESYLGYPAVIPPPYLAGRWPSAPRRLGGLERRVRGWPCIRSLGDHFLLILRRTSAVMTP